MIYAHQLPLIPRSFSHPTKRAFDFECQASWIGGILLISCCPIFSTISLTVTTVWQLFATCHFFLTQNGSSSRLLEWNFEFCRKMTITLCFTFHFHTSARILVILLLRVPSLSLGDLPTPTFFLWWLSIFLPSFVALLVLATWDPTGYPLSFMFIRLCFFVKRYCTCSSTQK